jgi:hypothetical protein
LPVSSRLKWMTMFDFDFSDPWDDDESERRPACPECGLEMVFVTVTFADKVEMFLSWQCDCPYRTLTYQTVPYGLIACIVRCREDGSASITYDWEDQSGQS